MKNSLFEKLMTLADSLKAEGRISDAELVYSAAVMAVPSMGNYIL